MPKEKETIQETFRHAAWDLRSEMSMLEHGRLCYDGLISWFLTGAGRYYGLDYDATDARKVVVSFDIALIERLFSEKLEDYLAAETIEIYTDEPTGEDEPIKGQPANEDDDEYIRRTRTIMSLKAYLDSIGCKYTNWSSDILREVRRKYLTVAYVKTRPDIWGKRQYRTKGETK